MQLNFLRGALATGLLMLVCSAPLAYSLYHDVRVARAMPGNNNPAPAASSPAAAISVDALAGTHFFGAPPAAQLAQHTQSSHAPETRMSLQLHGVIGSSIAEEGRALIAERGKSAKYYGVNDPLPGGAVVDSIGTNQVMLKRNGRLETLSFPKPASHPDSTTVATAGDKVDPPPQFQSLHESRVADHTETQPAHSDPATGDPSPSVMAIKERLKQLRESRDL